MISLIVTLLIAVVGVITAWLKYIQSPQRGEAQRRKEKEAVDEAIRKNDNDAIAYILSERLSKLRQQDKNNTGQQTDNKLSND